MAYAIAKLQDGFTVCDGQYTISPPFARGETASPELESYFAYYVSVIDNDTGEVKVTFRRNDAYNARLDAIKWAYRHSKW